MTFPEPSPTGPSPIPPMPGRKGMHRQLVSFLMVALLALVLSLELKRQAVTAQLQRLTVRLEQLQLGNEEQNREIARRVVQAVRQLIEIPEDIEPTVATIIDVNALRERNPFYNKAENGDYLVVTPDRAILYSTKRKIILDVVPVQLESVGQE